MLDPLRGPEPRSPVTPDDIIAILKAHEQIVYLPKHARKNPLTRGVVKDNFPAIAQEILEAINPVIKNTTI